MKTKLLTGFLIVLLALAGTIAWIIQDQTSHGMLSGEGGTLLKALPLSEIASITITGANEEVSLVKKAGRWVVENRFDYAADFSKISDFVEKLKLSKIGRRFPIREDIRKRLNLNQPTRAEIDDSEKGIQVLFKDQAGGVMADILFGKARRLDGTASIRIIDTATFSNMLLYFASLSLRASSARLRSKISACNSSLIFWSSFVRSVTSSSR